MTTKDILIAARGLIEKEESWCQGAWDRDGARCAHGAILSAIPRDDLRVEPLVVAAFVSACGGQPILGFNDSHTHAEVLAAFDKAIAECA